MAFANKGRMTPTGPNGTAEVPQIFGWQSVGSAATRS